jgi:hypothetical protein
VIGLKNLLNKEGKFKAEKMLRWGGGGGGRDYFLASKF